MWQTTWTTTCFNTYICTVLAIFAACSIKLQKCKKYPTTRNKTSKWKDHNLDIQYGENIKAQWHKSTKITRLNSGFAGNVNNYRQINVGTDSHRCGWTCWRKTLIGSRINFWSLSLCRKRLVSKFPIFFVGETRIEPFSVDFLENSFKFLRTGPPMHIIVISSFPCRLSYQ